MPGDVGLWSAATRRRFWIFIIIAAVSLCRLGTRILKRRRVAAFQRFPMQRRAVVTGIGWVTPMGAKIDEAWQKLLAGQSGVDRITIFDPTNFPTQIAAEVKHWSIAEAGEDPKEWQKVGRHTRFAVAAAKMAIADSGLEVGAQPSGGEAGAGQAKAGTPAIDPLRFGVYLGSGEGHQDFYAFSDMIVAALDGDKFDVAKFTKAGLERLDPVLEMEQEPNMPAGHLAALFNAQGPNANCLTACAASSQADRRGRRDDPPRRRRRDALRRHAQHDPPVRRHRLQPADGPLARSNDEPHARRRGRSTCTATASCSAKGPAMLVLEELEHAKRRGAHDLRRADRLRLDRRRLSA